MIENEKGMVELGKGKVKIKVCHNMSEIKSRLLSVKSILTSFSDIPQFMNWAKESSENPGIDANESMIERKPEYYVCGNDEDDDDLWIWCIEFHKLDETFIKTRWKWIARMHSIDHGCIFKDGDGQYWFAVCDYA